MPEEPLLAPGDAEISDESEILWEVVALNARVNQRWEELIIRAPSSAARCYHNLQTAPTTRQAGRVYPLKWKTYKGGWGYEVTGGDRVYYMPDPATRKVVVYYAGPHPKDVPRPP